MSKCIGCRCCEVACSEQNNTPPDIPWRRVGEIEGGVYPFTERFYLSMGCNHCLEPSCLLGCPVDAYKKDPVTGLVLHSAQTCIGCQYCTWNCPYGVPQYNPERGVVGKCDMCYGRLSQDRLPACVQACPQGAIAVEAVNVEQWKQQYARDANAPGLPSADQTISTTRITLPETTSPQLERADYHRVRPEAPHLPLVAMTVLTQLSVGALGAVWVLQWLRGAADLRVTAAASLLVGVISLGASILHLGRPIYAWRALRMWRRSWLSREVLLFTCFALAAALYAGALWRGAPALTPVGAAAALLGVAGITASARLYQVPARPAWNSPYTKAEFFLTALLLGPLFVATLGLQEPSLLAAAIAGAAGQLLSQALKFLWLARSEEFELRASARLLSGELEGRFLARLGLLLVGGIVLPLLGYGPAALWTALAAELLGRYLFFVSVAPKNMAAPFLAAGREAA
jgi:Fe-S-cluster-containing dehydrogenase component/DMSO reductase anchor subunit